MSSRAWRGAPGSPSAAAGRCPSGGVDPLALARAGEAELGSESVDLLVQCVPALGDLLFLVLELVELGDLLVFEGCVEIERVDAPVQRSPGHSDRLIVAIELGKPGRDAAACLGCVHNVAIATLDLWQETLKG